MKNIRVKRGTKAFAAFMAAIIAVLCFVMFPAFTAYAGAEEAQSATAGQSARLGVYFVDVGQGDCTIITLPDGKTMIIDGGDTDNKTATAIKTFIHNTLPSDFEYFDYCILTHSDSDHCGSLDDVLGDYPARVSYRPNVEASGSGFTDPGKADLKPGAKEKSTVAYRRAIDAMYTTIDGEQTTVYVTDPADDSQTITGGEGDDAYSLYFYSPLSNSYNDWNNYSPIMLLTYRGVRFAMSGDAEKENEREFVNKVNAAKTDGVTDKYDVFTDDFCVNVIKAGHHGSRTSTSQNYLDIMTTAEGAKSVYYIMSCGAGNSYGHPHSETLDKLAAMNVPDGNILRTDVAGDLAFTVRVGENGEYSLFYGDKAQPDVGGTGGGNTGTTGGNKDFTFDVSTRTVIILVIIIIIIVIIACCVYSHKNKKSGGKGEESRSSDSKSSGANKSGSKSSSGKKTAGKSSASKKSGSKSTTSKSSASKKGGGRRK